MWVPTRPTTLVFYDVFWRARDWYTNRAHNLHVRTNACACAHAQAHADLRIIKDYYFCFPYVRAAASAARASVRALSHVRRSRTRINRVPLSKSSGTFSIVCSVWTSTDARVDANTVPNFRDTVTQMNDGCVYGGTLRDAKREPLATRSGFFCN